MFLKQAEMAFKITPATFRIMVADGYFIFDEDYMIEVHDNRRHIIFTIDGVDKLFYYFKSGIINAIQTTGTARNHHPR